MTDAEAKELGLRALEVGFQWAPGVKLGSADETYRLTFAWYSGDDDDDDDDGATPVLHPAGDGIGPGWGWPADGSGWWPDFRDAATLGVLLALVREAWGDPHVYAMRLNVRRQIWVVHVPSDRHNIHGEGETEAAALVAALEAAP